MFKIYLIVAQHNKSDLECDTRNDALMYVITNQIKGREIVSQSRNI